MSPTEDDSAAREDVATALEMVKKHIKERSPSDNQVRMTPGKMDFPIGLPDDDEQTENLDSL